MEAVYISEYWTRQDYNSQSTLLPEPAQSCEENSTCVNRRLTDLIDQQKDDTARLTLRLSSTEKQRDLSILSFHRRSQ
jgi:hypothetical protein